MDQVLQFIFLVLIKLNQLIQPFLVPICFVAAWAILGLTLWNLIAATREGLTQAKQMHQIPCANCQYFTNSHFLKCPLHPMEALSESAIGCHDFESTQALSRVKDSTLV